MFTLTLLYLWYVKDMKGYIESKRIKEMPEMDKNFTRDTLFLICLILDLITSIFYLYLFKK